MHYTSKVLILGMAAIAIGTIGPRANAAETFKQEPLSVQVSPGNLAGTLTLPTGNGPFPVALIIAGSGPTDRDGNSKAGLQTDAYKMLAQNLATHGIASLRYDKRLVGSSTFPQSEADVRFDDFVNDASRLVDFLKADRRFSKIAIIGHSEGSLIGIIAAVHNPKVRLYVSLEGAGKNAAELIDDQVRAGGAPQAIVDEVFAADQQLKSGKLVPSPDPRLASLFRPSVQPYLMSWFRYDPAVELAKLQIPILIIQGTTDIQTSVADAKLLAASKPSAHLQIIQGMNHILRDAPADRAKNMATYAQPQLPLNAQVTPAIVKFIQSH